MNYRYVKNLIKKIERICNERLFWPANEIDELMEVIDNPAFQFKWCSYQLQKLIVGLMDGDYVKYEYDGHHGGCYSRKQQ